MRNYGPKHVELIGIINKPLLLHLVGCLYYYISDERSYEHQISIEDARSSQYGTPWKTLLSEVDFFFFLQITRLLWDRKVNVVVDLERSSIGSFSKMRYKLSPYL